MSKLPRARVAPKKHKRRKTYYKVIHADKINDGMLYTTPVGGHPTAYAGLKTDDLAYRLCLLGATNKELAEQFGVTEKRIRNWMRTKRSFKQAVDLGRNIADAEVADAMHRRATGFQISKEKLFWDGKNEELIRAETSEYFAPDVSAGKFWLINRRPQDWSDRSSHEMFGKGGGPIQINIEKEDEAV